MMIGNQIEKFSEVLTEKENYGRKISYNKSSKELICYLHNGEKHHTDINKYYKKWITTDRKALNVFNFNFSRKNQFKDIVNDINVILSI